MSGHSQVEYHSLWYNILVSVDGNTAQVVVNRFGKAELNVCCIRDAEIIQTYRLISYFPDAVSASVGLEPQPAIWLARDKVMTAV
jgi:hypothetical protein